jgi:hypothetical protein
MSISKRIQDEFERLIQRFSGQSTRRERIPEREEDLPSRPQKSALDRYVSCGQNIVLIAAALYAVHLYKDVNTDYDYHYDGNINGEEVHFYEEGLFNKKNHLEVTKRDGTRVIYSDTMPPEMKIDSLEIIRCEEDDRRKWDDSCIDRYVRDYALDTAQIQFDTYVSQIITIKRNGLLETTYNP